ncbi:MATH and LRR domain-containing protein PFE0570w-like isoform X2 [Malaya genurostris]|uniref:MATH and LRR domain-containing protein PFE0570w-like isoform X2 n=1 Tax=Malaya genurostris TaxID=325434 RepID=UPI0026F3CBF7|nr:MATH and LRR domain-containing protein PFE0570w-like isoform X2 [Malaya genurostris]
MECNPADKSPKNALPASTDKQDFDSVPAISKDIKSVEVANDNEVDESTKNDVKSENETTSAPAEISKEDGPDEQKDERKSVSASEAISTVCPRQTTHNDDIVEEDKFEDASDLEVEKEVVKIPLTEENCIDQNSQSTGSNTSLKAKSSEEMATLQYNDSEAYEIDSSPEKPPNNSVVQESKPIPGPSSSKQSIKSVEIETVELDDDDDDDDDEDGDGPLQQNRRDSYDDEEEDYDEDDYYDDPDSDDQDVNRVIQEACDEIDAINDVESCDDDKMDVSSDEEDYSENDEDERSSKMFKAKHKPKLENSRSVKRNGSDYSEDDEMYGEEEDYDYDDDVEEVVELDKESVQRKIPQAHVSMGRISVEDESEEDVQEKKKVQKVKHKTYRQKLVSKLRKRTFKLLNKRSMHVMEEGGDVLACSDAKIVSLKSTINNTAKPTIKEASEIQTDNDIISDSILKPKSTEEISTDSKLVAENCSNEENKENITVKDNSKCSENEMVVDDKAKPHDDEQSGNREQKSIKSEEEDVMNDIDDIIEDVKYQNGSKADFNEELTFQMDVDGSQPDDENPYDEENEEDDDEEGAVDLSSSYDANKSDREDCGKQSQTDESDAVELIDSSPEKLTQVVTAKKPAKKPNALTLESDLNNSSKIRSDKSLKVDEVDKYHTEKQDESTDKLPSASKSSRMNEAVSAERSDDTEFSSRKRRRSIEKEDFEEERSVPSKKLKRELECNFRSHDRLLKEYIETTSNSSVDDVQKHTDALVVEIRTLNEMIRAKEDEWNNMIHLKKVKEEILLRLTRKKHVMDITDTKLGEVSEYSHFDSSNLTNVRSASVGPRPPTPPPEVDVRPASVAPMHSSTLNSSKNANISNHSISSSRKENSLLTQFNHSNSSVTMVPLSTASSLITSTNTILQSRANMKSAEVAKEKSNAVQIQRQILPKPILSNHQQILNNLAMSAGLTAAAITSTGTTSISNSSSTATVSNVAAINNILAGLSAQAAALLNGHHSSSGINNHQQGNQLQVGRQGVIKDVKSIIADYRQKHPEQVPRRGRRLKNIPNSGYDKSGAASAASRMTELSFLLAAAEQQSQQNAAANLSKGAYPEVTLHPVLNSNSNSGSNAVDMNQSAGSNTSVNQSQNNNNNSTNSLLHGILTKTSSRPNAAGFTSFSPTLARLLTAPERMNSQASTVTSGALANLQASTGLNLSKSNSEITITPVGASNLQQSLLAHQQQLQEQQKQLQRLREQHFLNMDDEADDSVDRLVIDEGDDHHGTSSGNHHRERNILTTRSGNRPEFHENDVPECQGCKKREAQFVCAGCGNQWYCSRDCQVNAWDDHSEVCTG